MRWLAAVMVALATPALAWESTCYVYADGTLEPASYFNAPGAACALAGPQTARGRWVGGLDEHRQLWERTREAAGLPAAVSATLRLRVFTSSTPLQVGTQTLTSLQPVPFQQATREQVRAISIGELAQLPDWSYSLWDWALGNETCPLEGAAGSAELCHDFASHMGPVNSNHFLPQAQRFYARYHALALARAAECKAMAAQLVASAARFDEYPKACELEALALESVGQHFLQDAWSMGHMWQRWGSPNLLDFPAGADQRDRAALIALTAGLVHGSRGVLQRLPAWSTYDVNDALCAPNSAVRYVRNDGVLLQGIGDDYLAKLFTASEYGGQHDRLLSCAASGMLQVYEAAGATHGAPSTPATGLVTVNPVGPECFGQRATNASMLEAAAVQLNVGGQQVNLTLDARLVGWLLPKVARNQAAVPVSAKLRNQYRYSLQRIVSVARLVAAESPDGTELAEGRLGEFLGVKPNAHYADAFVTYVEPALPWPATPDVSQAAKDRATALARLFHRAHAKDWCGLTDAPALAALKAHAADTSLDAPGRLAACSACAEVASRHLRVGTDSAQYDAVREPLCGLLNASPAYVYQPDDGADVNGLALAWCGCR